MKKFSTAGNNFALAAIISTLFGSVLLASQAFAADPLAPAGTAGKTQAYAPNDNAPVPAAASCAFLANAPDQHVVVPGNTLWGISGRFLQHPWCWPQVWDLNREQIRNPHWIYPGQVVYFDRAAGRLRLGKGVGDGGASGTVVLTPQVRSQNLERDAIASIPSNIIEPFLSQPLIVEAGEMANAPHIVATTEGHVYLGRDDKAYVRGDLTGHTLFQVFRPAKPLLDPISKEVLGYEAAYLGIVRLDRAGRAENEAHRFIVDNVKQEMGTGDLLVPMPATPLINYVPHRPDAPMQANVVSVYGGVGNAGRNDVITVSVGKKQGVDIGTVLDLYRAGTLIEDAGDHNKPVMLPDEKYGTLFIFRVFNNISYGLVMSVSDVVQIGDAARTPE
ncbi:MAG: LysM peptidoglycan-binding domain-containing protein [Janthinobacterium lividum]